MRDRSRDFLEMWIKPNLRNVTPEWEHMMRCMIEGFTYYLPMMSFEMALVHVMQILDVPVPRFYSSMSIFNWIRYKFLT